MGKNKILAGIGLVLIIFAIISFVGIITAPYEDPKDPVSPVYVPAEGTEDFIFGTVEQNGHWVTKETGIYNTGTEPAVYGTLYTSDVGYWVIVDPRGQAPASGGIGSPIPELVGENT